LVVRFGTSFTMSTYVLFLLSMGLILFEVNLVNFTYFTTLFLFEVPTGIVADVFGRKLSYVLSSIVFGSAFFIYAASDSLPGFLLAEATAAVGTTLATGAFQAWLVDRLNYFGFRGSLDGLFAREQLISNLATIGGAVMGGALATIGFAVPWVVGGAVVFASGVVAAFVMKEEYFTRRRFSMRANVRAMFDTVRTSLSFGRRSSVVKFVAGMGILQLFAVQAPNMQWQPFFSQFFSGTFGMGLIFGGISAALAMGALLAPRLVRTIRLESQALVWTQVAIGIGIIAASLTRTLPAALAVFLLHEVARGVYRPLRDAYLNHHIPSLERATLLSLAANANNAGAMVGLLISGFVAEMYSIPVAWMLGGSVLIIGTLVLVKRNGYQ
ncbi:MAG: MFS transporter, partial [Patescibacteria group bacterium]